MIAMVNKQKIIFLDIDGVLNVIGQGYDQFGQIFHKHLVANLQWIINETNAKIVISSTWRIEGLNKMKEMWEYRNLPGEVIDVTPIIGNGQRVKRGYEIQEWIDKNSNIISNYCIIDDDNDMLPHQMNNFVLTSYNEDHNDCVDIGWGLTRECSEKVVEILNSK